MLQIKERGMKIHCYTFRNEYIHLKWDYGQDPYEEYEEFIEVRNPAFG